MLSDECKVEAVCLRQITCIQAKPGPTDGVHLLGTMRMSANGDDPAAGSSWSGVPLRSGDVHQVVGAVANLGLDQAAEQLEVVVVLVVLACAGASEDHLDGSYFTWICGERTTDVELVEGLVEDLDGLGVRGEDAQLDLYTVARDECCSCDLQDSIARDFHFSVRQCLTPSIPDIWRTMR